MGESLFLNGVDLSTLVRNVESLAALLRTPPRRGSNLLVPGRHGQLSRADRPFDAGELVLPMWVVGADEVTGESLAGDAAVTAFYSHVDELVSLLHAPALTFDHTLPDTSVRRVVAELAGGEPLEFTRQVGSPLFGRVDVPISLPDAFWFEPTTTSTGALTFTSGQERTLAEFAGATAPMADLDIVFGQGNNPELHQVGTDGFVAYDGVIGPGQTLTIHCDDTHPTPLEGTGGLVPDYTKLRYLPPRWFELDPTAGLDVALVHTGGGSMSCTVSGNRKFLTG